ncbi:MAG: flagellar biosynthesis protein FliQ [Planctomycetota bacterium]
MTADTLVEILREGLFTALMVMLPPLLTALALGLGVGLLQAITSIQEATLSFVPKILGIGVVMVMLGPWMLRMVVAFSTDLFERLASIGTA